MLISIQHPGPVLYSIQFRQATSCLAVFAATAQTWIHSMANKVRFCNQISTLPQPNFDDSATKLRYASATKKRRFRNQKKRFRNQKRTIPQPKQDDSATKIRAIRKPKSASLCNQDPRHFATKTCASTLCMASSPSATVNMASSSDAVG